MPVTQVSVCNSALIKIGDDRISSITQETKSARILNAIWDQVRDEVLRAHPWNFAIKRATLAPTGDEPDHEYEYEYDLPADCLRILSTYPDTIAFVIEDGKILTDEPDELCVRYIYRNTDPSSWDACFAEALAWRLAREVAYNLSGTAALIATCDEGYKRALAEARTMDGTEGTLSVVIDDWIDSRR